MMGSDQMQRHHVEVSRDITYAVVDEGEGPAVLLLHGFPDSSHLWRHQVPALVDAGFRVIAPDLRGFGDSSKPLGVENYALTRILGDVTDLLKKLGVPRAHVVGHDWGAAVAWLMASLMPKRVDHLAVLSVGHPQMYHWPTREQREKSWYMLMYQFEGVAERLMAERNWALFREGVEGGDVEAYVRRFADTHALTSALNWYRANRRPEVELEPSPRLPFVKAPTLAMWGEGDMAMTESAMVESEGFVWGPWRYERIPDAGHWIPLTAPNRLNELLVEFLGSHELAASAVPTRTRRSF